jgi:hypothetical protein
LKSGLACNSANWRLVSSIRGEVMDLLLAPRSFRVLSHGNVGKP